MGNAYLDRKAGIGKTGRKAETRTASRLALRPTPASGAAIGKGDLRGSTILVEVKSTINDSLSLKYEWLVKITDEATLTGKSPALSIVFTTPNGQPHRAGAWVCIPEHLYAELLQSIATE